MRQSENHPLYMIVEVFMPVLGDEPRVVDNPDFVIEPRKRVEQLSGGQFRRTERLKRQIREVLVDCLMNLVPYAKANVTVIRDHRDRIHLRLQLAHELYGLRNKGRLFENGEVVPLVISDAGTIVLLSRFPLSRSSIDSGIESRE